MKLFYSNSKNIDFNVKNKGPIFRPSSCIWDQDQGQALKNVILGQSSDPRIKIKD